MILYNVTVIIDHTCENDWLSWMKSKHIPDVMNTNMFLECRISKIQAQDEGGQSYAISYVAENQTKLDEYATNFSEALQKDHNDRYAGKFAAFRTTMEIMHEFKQA